MYALGIDLGTTFTAAAVWRDGRAEISSLGSRTAAIPSVVVLREDQTIVTGETASRRALSAPHRVAREFKRRLGDTTPILLGGSPYSAEALMARVLRAVVDEVSAREGGPPTSVAVSHPANWGPYKTDLLRQAVRGANLDDAKFTTEPEAAAVFYARQTRLPDGAIVAVYDLGGGTFDAAVLRKNADGFEILGRPEGIERLGGIDFDAAVFAHVARALGSALDDLDEDDSATIAAVARLREECTEAKEALSSDTDTTIPVLLPNLTTEVRLTRAEFESMVRPSLQDTIDALRRALRSAQVVPEQLHSILLVGGSSRMPIVGQLVGVEFGRPVAVDVHPKHAVALGAAWLASGMPSTTSRAATPDPIQPSSVRSHPDRSNPGQSNPGQSNPGQSNPGQSNPGQSNPGRSRPPVTPTPSGPFPQVTPAARSQQTPSSINQARSAETRIEPPPADPIPGGQQRSPLPSTGSTRTAGNWDTEGNAAPVLTRPPSLDLTSKPPPRLSRLQAMGAAAAATVVVIIIAVAALWVLKGRSDDSTTPAVAATCTSTIKANTRWVCLTDASFDGTTLTLRYKSDFAGSTPNAKTGYNVHIYGSNGKTPADKNEGAQSLAPGHWVVADTSPVAVSTSSKDYKSVIGTNAKVCARIATSDQVLVKDTNGTYVTGNCIPITHT
jgi:actin-like ATPase involved in cell morphogenesis